MGGGPTGQGRRVALEGEAGAAAAGAEGPAMPDVALSDPDAGSCPRAREGTHGAGKGWRMARREGLGSGWRVWGVVSSLALSLLLCTVVRGAPGRKLEETRASGHTLEAGAYRTDPDGRLAQEVTPTPAAAEPKGPGRFAIPPRAPLPTSRAGSSGGTEPVPATPSEVGAAAVQTQGTGSSKKGSGKASGEKPPLGYRRMPVANPMIRVGPGRGVPFVSGPVRQLGVPAGAVASPLAPVAPAGPQGYVGLVLHTRGGVAFVKRVIPGWPAEEAGLRPGDLVLAVDGLAASASSLDAALNGLSGRAGETVQVRVRRPGEPNPIVFRIVRSGKPVSEPPRAKASPLPPDPLKKAVEDAIAAWSKGERLVLERLLTSLAAEDPTAAAEALLRVVEGLMDVGGEEAQARAVQVARLAAVLYPGELASPLMARRCFPEGMEQTSEMRELAELALRNLKERAGTRKLPSELAESERQWRLVRGLGLVREGRVRPGYRAMKRALKDPPVGLLALGKENRVLWKVPVRPAEGWEELVGVSLARGWIDRSWEGIRQVLALDEPPWVYAAAAELARQGAPDEAQGALLPQMPVQRYTSEFGTLLTPRGESVGLVAALNGRPGVLLHCVAMDEGCEAWRLPLSAAVGEDPTLKVLLGLVLPSKVPAPAGTGWPVYFRPSSLQTLPLPPAIQVVDGNGQAVARYGAYESGLEQRVLELLREVGQDGGGTGPFLVRGGVNQEQWSLRLLRRQPPVLDAAVGGPEGAARLWVLGPGGRLDVVEEGQVRRTVEGLSGVDRVMAAELDGDPGEELLVWHRGEGLLEALESSGMPRWILPGERAVELVYPYDVDGDGRDEVFLTREGDNALHCYSAEGALRWGVSIPGGVRGLAGGNRRPYGLGVVSRQGRLQLLSAQGESRGEVSVGQRVWQVGMLDVDGDGEDDVLVGGEGVEELLPVNLGGDGERELLVRVGSRQLLQFDVAGKMLSRVSWEAPVGRMSRVDLDRDGEEDVLLVGAFGDMQVISWTDVESSVR